MEMRKPIYARAGPITEVAEGASGLITPTDSFRCVPIDTAV